MISIYKQDDFLIFSYHSSEGDDKNWLAEKIKTTGAEVIKKTFRFTVKDVFRWPKVDDSSEDLYYDSLFDIQFVFGTKEGDYFRLTRGIVIDDFDIYLYKDLTFDPSLFVASPKISIFRVLKSLMTSDFYIGGAHPDAVPENIFATLISKFPNDYEKKKYVEARVSAILRNYVQQLKDGELAYHRYMKRKESRIDTNLRKLFKAADLEKYQTMLERLQNMLANQEGYTEKVWQEQILQLLLLLYPKYIYVFREVTIPTGTSGSRHLDFLLIDSNGYVDIVEIKQPFDKCIVTENQYRNNYVPLRELSGAIMQIEKYIYNLNRWGIAGENALTEKYRAELPAGFTIKITNANGIIIMGREHQLTAGQKEDFEVIKRKYKHVADIITYDSLLYRLKCLIEQTGRL